MLDHILVVIVRRTVIAMHRTLSSGSSPFNRLERSRGVLISSRSRSAYIDDYFLFVFKVIQLVWSGDSVTVFDVLVPPPTPLYRPNRGRLTQRLRRGGDAKLKSVGIFMWGLELERA